MLVVIGGGIAGLAGAHRLHERAPHARVVVLEAADRLGGLLHTHREGSFVMEEAAENFLTQVPWAMDLCQRVGLGERLVSTDPATRGALVVHRGRLRPIPPGFALLTPTRVWPIVTSGALSLRGKLRLAMEPFVAAGNNDSDESIASFVRRRLGNEAYERLVEPLVGSIYGANPAEISLAAVLPQFAQMERKHGSLWRAQRKANAGRRKRSGDRRPPDPFAAPREGMSSLIDALAARIGEGAVQRRSPVTQLRQDRDGRWTVTVGGENPRRFVADGVVLAPPAVASSRLLCDFDAALADALSQIAYRDVTLVALGYHRDQIAHPLDSHGIVIPSREERRLLSVSFSSIKYGDRAPQGTVLLRASLRQDDERLAKLDDDQLREVVTVELAQLLRIRGCPIFCRVVRRSQAMPIYRIGHSDRLACIRRLVAKHPRLALAGAAYGGSGVPYCIRSGEQAADEILSQLSAPYGGRQRRPREEPLMAV